jgi:hypothetical protein
MDKRTRATSCDQERKAAKLATRDSDCILLERASHSAASFFLPVLSWFSVLPEVAY